MAFYNYSYWLIGLSLLFIGLELLFPVRKISFFRREIWHDLFYIFFNSNYFFVLLGWLFFYAPILNLPARFDRFLIDHDWHDTLYRGVMENSPLWLQIIVAVLVIDFTKYLIHNTLHRVPWLWEFHKVHHSIVDLDWIGNWRFHWFEALFYNSLTFFPAVYFGFNPYALFWYGIIGTFIGHFAHANLKVTIGPLKYLFNSPELHIWHHIHPDSGPINKNFGVVLSLWDWIFGTAYLPENQTAKRLGFAEIERFPRAVWKQLIIPIRWVHHRVVSPKPE